MGRQWETRGDKTSEGGHTIQHRHTCGETMGDNGAQPETRGDGETKRETMGDNWDTIGRTKGQVEKRPWGGGQTIQHGRACEETRGNKTSGRRTHHPTQADKGRQDRGKADTPSKAEAPSNTGTHVGREWETRGDKTLGRRKHHPTQAHRETMGDNEKQDFGKADHPTQAHMWGDNWRQWETIGDNWRQG